MIALAIAIVGCSGVLACWDIYRRRQNAQERSTDVLKDFRDKLEGMSTAIEELQGWRKQQTTSESARAIVAPRPRN